MNILNQSHNRSGDFNKEIKKIFDSIELFGDEKNLEPIFLHFEKNECRQLLSSRPLIYNLIFDFSSEYN